MVGILGSVLENRTDDVRGTITEEMLMSTSFLLNFVTGWTEITDETERFQTTSNILTFVDNLGFLYSDRSACQEESVSLASTNINLTIRTFSQPPLEEVCFDPAGSGQQRICLPPASLPHSECSTAVSTHFALDQARMELMFPREMKNYVLLNREKIIFNPHLIGLTINNESLDLDQGLLVAIEFEHNGFEVKNISFLILLIRSVQLATDRHCVWWSHTDLSWSSAGCELSSVEITEERTVCHCDHLTNFAIMFDFQGKAEVDDKILNTLTNVCLSISCYSILLTQAFLAFIK